MLLEMGSGGTHASRGGKHKRTEMCVLNFMNSLFGVSCIHSGGKG